MLKFLRLAPLMIVAVLATACVSFPKDRMQPVPANAETKTPLPGKALVYFVRTSQYAGVLPADLYDDEAYIGSIAFGQYLAYQATPGQRLFMVTGETAEFMPAELLAGKTYYANVGAHLGMWKARFHISPQNGNLPQGELNNAMSMSTEVRLAEGGRKWAAENAESVHRLKAEFLPKWEQSGERARHTLQATSGR
jgi:hypothetical protein